jgi:hypothetical protein
MQTSSIILRLREKEKNMGYPDRSNLLYRKAVQSKNQRENSAIEREEHIHRIAPNATEEEKKDMAHIGEFARQYALTQKEEAEKEMHSRRLTEDQVQRVMAILENGFPLRMIEHYKKISETDNPSTESVLSSPNYLYKK